MDWTGDTYLNNADILKHGNKILLITRTLGRPSSPQPQRRLMSPRQGQTLNQLAEELIAAYVDENGE